MEYGKSELIRRTLNAARLGWTSQKIKDLIDSLWRNPLTIAYKVETATGTVDGENKTYTLEKTPVGEVVLFIYPVTILLPGTYTVTDKTITLGESIVAPVDEERIIAHYPYNTQEV